MKLSSGYYFVAVITLLHVYSFDIASYHQSSLLLRAQASGPNPSKDEASTSEIRKLPSTTPLTGQDNDRLPRNSLIRLDPENPMPQDENIVHTYVSKVRQFREEGTGTARDLINRAGSDAERQVQLKFLEEEFWSLEKDLGELHFHLHETLARSHLPKTRRPINTMIKLVGQLESLHQFMSKPVHTSLRHFAAGDIQKSISDLQPAEYEEEDMMLFDRIEKLFFILQIENKHRALGANHSFYSLLRIFFQTIECAYKHELMNQNELRRLFKHQLALKLATQNMFESFWYEHRSIGFIYVVDGNDILQSWYSSHFRNIIDALDTEQKRTVSYYFLQFNDSMAKLNNKVQNFNRKISWIQSSILQEEEALEALKDLHSDDYTIKNYWRDVSVALEATLKEFQKFQYTKYAPPRPSGHEFQELNFLFQVLDFVMKNSFTMQSTNSVTDLYAKNAEFRRKMDAMSISNWLLQRLETIEIYLQKYLISPISLNCDASISKHMANEGKSVSDGEICEEDQDKESHKKEALQEKLQALSIYVQHLLFQHRQEMANLHSKKLGKQFRQVYCHSQHISQKIKNIETQLNKIQSNHLSESSSTDSSDNQVPKTPVITSPSKLWASLRNFLKNLSA